MREQTGKEDIIKDWIDGEGEMEMDKLVSTQRGLMRCVTVFPGFYEKKRTLWRFGQ